MRIHSAPLAAAVLTFAMTASDAAWSQSINDRLFAGKTIDFIIGSRAGGGYHAYGTLLSRHIGRYLPGKPTVVARNMDGAGSLIAASYLFNKAPHDGTTFGALFMGAIMEPLIGDASQARFDPRKFHFVGSANRETSVCIAWHTSPIKTFDDMFKTEMIVGTSGVTSSIQQYPTVLNSVLGTKFKMITGYTGSQEAALAMERGETQGICGIQWSSFLTSYQSWLETGKVRIIAQISSPEGDPALNKRGVPKVWNWVTKDSDRRTLTVILSQLDFGRPYVLPPGVSADVVKAYREAFSAVVQDPAFLDEAKKMAIDIDAIGGAQVQKIVEDIYATPPADVERARAALKG